MSGFLPSSLQEIVSDHKLTHRQQEERVKSLIGTEGVLSFLLSLNSLNNDHFLIVMSILSKFLDCYDGIILDNLLQRTIEMVGQRHDTRINVSFVEMLKWDLKKNIDEAVARHHTNIDQIVSFSVENIIGDDLEASEKASDILRALLPLRPSHYLPILHSASLGLKQLNTSASRTILLRIYSLVCDLCKSSEDFTAIADSAGFSADIVTLCKTEDILVQVVAMELLVALSCTERGLESLNHSGGVSWLIRTACGALPSDPVTQDEALRCLGSIFSHASKHSILFVEHCEPGSVTLFLNTIMAFLDEGDEKSKINGLACLSDFMAISAYSLQRVLQHGNGNLLQAWMRLTLSSKPEMHGAALTSIAMVLFQTDEQYVNNERAEITKQALGSSVNPEEQLEETPLEVSLSQVRQLKKELFGALNTLKRNNAIEYLIATAKQPVPSTRYPAVQLMTALAGQRGGWGLQLLFQGASSEEALLQSSFFTYLSNRLTETMKEGKDFKFALIHAVAFHPVAQNFPPELNRRLQQMVKQGAYYMPPAMEELLTA